MKNVLLGSSDLNTIIMLFSFINIIFKTIVLYLQNQMGSNNYIQKPLGHCEFIIMLLYMCYFLSFCVSLYFKVLKTYRVVLTSLMLKDKDDHVYKVT